MGWAQRLYVYGLPYDRADDRVTTHPSGKPPRSAYAPPLPEDAPPPGKPWIGRTGGHATPRRHQYRPADQEEVDRIARVGAEGPRLRPMARSEIKEIVAWNEGRGARYRAWCEACVDAFARELGLLLEGKS